MDPNFTQSSTWWSSLEGNQRTGCFWTCHDAYWWIFFSKQRCLFFDKTAQTATRDVRLAVNAEVDLQAVHDFGASPAWPVAPCYSRLGRKTGETSTEIRSRKNGIQMDPAFRCISDSHFGYEKDVPKKWRNRTPRPQSPLVSDALHPLLTGAWEPLQVGDFQLKTNRGWKSTTGACSTEGRTLLPATWPPAMVKTRCNLSWWRLNVTATGNNTANLTKKVGNIKFGICDLWLENLNVRHGAFYSTYSTNKCWTAWLHLSPL